MIKDRKLRRKYRIRKKIHGTNERPRISFCKSLRSLSVQVIDDDKGKTLCSALIQGRKNVAAAQELGKQLADKAGKCSVKKVVLDRNGRGYKGAIRAFADSARKHGLDF